MCYISAPEQNPLRINYRVYFHHDNKTSPSARMWLMAQIKQSIIMFLWIFDHCIRAVTGSQICWTVFILSSRKLSSELICGGGLHGSVRSFTRGQKPRDAKRQKCNSERGRRRGGYPDNQFINYQISLQVRHSLLCIYIFHCIVLNSVCKVVNTSHFRLTCFFVRGRCVRVCGLHELLACVCVFTCTHSQQWRVWRPESFPGSPSCPTPQGPGWGALWLPGTRPSSAMKAHGPKHTTEAESHSTPQDTQRIIFILKVTPALKFKLVLAGVFFFLFPKFLLELISAQQNPGLLYLCLPSAPVSTLHLSLGKTRNDN